MRPQNNPGVNLDIRCAELGRQLAAIKDMEEKVINDALAVLEQQGPYAMFLYIMARYKERQKGKEIAAEFGRHFERFLGEIFGREAGQEDALGIIKAIGEELDDLLFARDLIRAALSYARYHLKAQGS